MQLTSVFPSVVLNTFRSVHIFSVLVVSTPAKMSLCPPRYLVLKREGKYFFFYFQPAFF